MPGLRVAYPRLKIPCDRQAHRLICALLHLQERQHTSTALQQWTEWVDDFVKRAGDPSTWGNDHPVVPPELSPFMRSFPLAQHSIPEPSPFNEAEVSGQHSNR